MNTNDRVPLAVDTLRLIADAREESIRMHHEYIGTEHMLLALTRDDADRTASPLAELGVDTARVHQLVVDTVRGGRGPLPANLERPFTSRTKAVLAYAEEAARELGQSYVDVGHVLHGIMREQRSIAAQILHDDGLTAEVVETKIRRAAGGGLA